MIRRATQIGALLALSAIAPARAETVGKVGVDWVGNDIMIEAVADPGLPAVTCYVTYFDRSVFDRLQNGNWFENPSIPPCPAWRLPRYLHRMWPPFLMKTRFFQNASPWCSNRLPSAA